jgi:hypothetical protein
MRVKKRRAATSAKVTAQKNIQLIETYRNCTPKSSENLQYQIGLLLWQLQSPLSKHQRKVGWRLLGILLMQYVTIRGEAL